MWKFGVFALLAVATAFAQSPPGRSEFEVASVKPTVDARAGAGRSSPGHLVMNHETLKNLITLAYKVSFYRIVGGPAWVNELRYDIAATAEHNETEREMFPMLQPLLEDRFRLAVHSETRELPVYFLEAAKGGLKLSPPDCVTPTPDSKTLPPAAPGQPRLYFCGTLGPVLGHKNLDGYGTTMRSFTNSLSGLTGREVIDRTGFTDKFDVHLEYGGVFDSPPDSGAPSLFTALQEQAGLKLESQKAPVEVLVIDHAEKPDPN